MKRIMAMTFVAAMLCVPAAQASTQKSPTMAQFNALKAQLVKDEKRIKLLETGVSAAFGVILCENALNADAFQGTWQAVDALAVSLGKPAIFGPQATIVNDDNACADYKITRSHTAQPNVSLFSSLATLIIG